MVVKWKSSNFKLNIEGNQLQQRKSLFASFKMADSPIRIGALRKHANSNITSLSANAPFMGHRITYNLTTGMTDKIGTGEEYIYMYIFSREGNMIF